MLIHSVSQILTCKVRRVEWNTITNVKIYDYCQQHRKICGSDLRLYPCGFDVYISEFASERHLWERTEDVHLKEMNCKTGCPCSSLWAVHPQGKFSLLETNLPQKTENLQTQAVYSLLVSTELVTQQRRLLQRLFVNEQVLKLMRKKIIESNRQYKTTCKLQKFLKQIKMLQYQFFVDTVGQMMLRILSLTHRFKLNENTNLH